MQLMIAEINRSRNYARKRGLNFAVRINGTSDISPEDFIYNGKNILEMYPDIQFYDYTKVAGRISILNKYANYDLTFSYDGYNWETAEKYLKNGGRVAVVFAGDKLPETFAGYKVINGNNYDMRYLDGSGVIIGLSYHPVANDYKIINGVRTFVAPETPFVIKQNDPRYNA